MAYIVPPGGHAGFMQMTPASKAALSRGVRSGGPRRRRRKATKVARAARKRTKSKKGGGRMKFGSPGWQKKYRVGKFAKKKRG